jgi:hypothetical protein
MMTASCDNLGKYCEINYHKLAILVAYNRLVVINYL